MSRFECPFSPFDCDNSIWFEVENSKGEFVRWVECSESYQACDLRTFKIIWVECESFYLFLGGERILILKGTVCVNNPKDWWLEYLEREGKEERGAQGPS